MLPKMKMSQNAITTSTRNWLGRLCLLAGAVAGVLSCEEPKEIGLPPTTPVDILFTDTLTIVRETVRFDSIRSNDQSNLMVGGYTDPLFGKIEAKAFVQSRLASDFVVTDTLTNNVTVASRIILDSTRLVLDLNGAWYGDTTRAQEIQVFRMTDSLRATANYDIQSTAPTEAQPLVKQLVRPRPTARDSLNARFVLPASYGQQILALANTDAGKLANPAAFQAQFRSGLLLAASPATQSAILGYLPGFIPNNSNIVYGSFVVVYYHVAGETSRRQQFLLLSGKRFNQITADRAGTPLVSLQKGQTVAAAATQGQTFVQPGTGIATKLTFPTLTNLANSGRVAINRADLVITPAKPTDPKLYFPQALVMAELDERNQLRRVPLGGFPYVLPSFGPLDRTVNSFFSPQEALYVPRTNDFTFELGGYFQSIVSKLSPNTGLVLLMPGGPLFPGGRSNAVQQYLTDRPWRMVLEGKSSVKLVVFYTRSK